MSALVSLKMTTSAGVETISASGHLWTSMKAHAIAAWINDISSSTLRAPAFWYLHR